MKVLLHIGQSKTGTSAIQAFLTLNRNKLREIGILYPAVRVRGIPVNLGAHNAIADALVDKLRFPYLTADQYFNQFFEEARQINAELLILSAEHFFGGEPRPWEVDGEEEYFRIYKNKIENLAGYLRGHDVSVIVYLRPQIDWLSSAVCQTVRIDRLISDKQVYKSDRQYYEMMKPMLKYSKMLDIWESVIKPSSFMVVPYNRKTLYKNSSISDFLYRVGLNNIEFPYATADIQVNESFTREYLEVKKQLNCQARTKNTERVIIRCLDRLSRSSDFGTRYELDSDVRRDAVSFAESENEAVNRKYQSDSMVFVAQTDSYGSEQKAMTAEDVRRAMGMFRREYRRTRYKLLWLNLAARTFLRTYAKPVQAILHQAKMAYLGMKFRN